MEWLPDGEKILKISLFVLAQLTNVTEGQTDGQTDRHRVTEIAALCIASHGKNRLFGNGDGSGKVTPNPYAGLDHHQNLNSSSHW